MQVDEYTFNSYMSKLNKIIGRFLPELQDETTTMIENFIVEINKTEGVPQPNTPWNLIANVRGGYWATVPGIVSEVISMWNVAPLGSEAVLTNAYEEHIQLVDKIDYFSDESSYQVKTVRINQQRLLIESDYSDGIANFVSLVDIDQHSNHIIERTKLVKFKNKYIQKYDLEQMSKKVYNNEGKY